MKKALIIYGGWTGHTPKETALLFKDWLEKKGMNVTVSDTLDVLNDYESIRQYDLFVPMWTKGSIDFDQCRNLSQAVSEGAGLAGCHGGMCDAFRGCCQWQFMTGAQFVGHPGGEETEYTVHLLPGNPFTEGLTDFDIRAEQYYMLVDPAVQVHATTDFPVADGPHAANGTVKMPVLYTKKWGKGKIFYNSLGHTYKTFDIPQVKEMMLRGLLWATR